MRGSFSMCSYRERVPSRAGNISRKAVMYFDFVYVFILSNNVSVSQVLSISLPVSFSSLIKVIFIDWLSVNSQLRQAA